MTPFDDAPQRACEGGRWCTQNNLHHTGHTFKCDLCDFLARFNVIKKCMNKVFM